MMPRGRERVYQDCCQQTGDDEILAPTVRRSFDEGHDVVEVCSLGTILWIRARLGSALGPARMQDAGMSIRERVNKSE